MESLKEYSWCGKMNSLAPRWARVLFMLDIFEGGKSGGIVFFSVRKDDYDLLSDEQKNIAI